MILTLKVGLHLINFNQQLKGITIFKLLYGGTQVLLLITKIIFKLEKMVVLKLQYNKIKF